MKVGSLVVVKPLPPAISLVVWEPKDDESTIYTIRGIVHCPVYIEDVAFFEEGVLGYNTMGEELGIPLEWLREIQPPQDLTELIEECLHMEV